MPRVATNGALKMELEERIRSGRCAYCRRPARPDRPLTREHVIPRARGGRRKDVRIIVPACARCNHHRGCKELVPFLLAKPRRISAFLDYLSSLDPNSVREMDLRVFAELYTAIWMLSECSEGGREWREQLRRLSSGRTLHRRRYAARRVVGAVDDRIPTLRDRGRANGGPSCIIPNPIDIPRGMQLGESLERLSSRLLGILSLVWGVSAEDVRREMARQLNAADGDGVPLSDPDDVVLPLDGWRRRTRRRRMRVDQRGGRAPSRGGRRAA